MTSNKKTTKKIVETKTSLTELDYKRTKKIIMVDSKENSKNPLVVSINTKILNNDTLNFETIL